ncbi:hypothetical protein R5R35_006539 [Gryllus longicercus]|uniref:Anaphase-promoting complex subunit 4 n=1 Tax=Gryllus longicercus TaxID=2509291 RepID=A0AAN9V965_9ORTH
MSTSNAMRQLEERHVATKVELLVWSNKMDLLALSNVRGEVALHRLTWQKVWSLPPPTEGSTVKGMAWRPDGKVIAIAYSTCEILLVDVENKETLHSAMVDGEVTFVTWAQEKDHNDSKNILLPKQKDVPKYSTSDTSSNFLPKLPSLSRSFGSVNKCLEENLEDAKKIKEQNLLNILIVGLLNGKLYLSIFGLFPCGVIDLHDYIICKNCKVVDADVSEDLNILYIGVLQQKENDGPCELSLVLLDTNILSCQAAELHSLALKHGHIASLLGYLSQTMNSITEAWENILVEMDSKLATYASTVPDGSVSADFLDLLMFGTASDEMEMFLLQDLTEKGLKKLGHSIELSYSNIQKLVLKHLHSVGQSLVYHLAELRGMARRTDRYEILGLSEDGVASSLAAAGAFLVKGAEVQQVIDNSMKNYKIFFRWLYVAILRLSDERVPPEITKISQQELSFLAEFLYNFDGSDCISESGSGGGTTIRKKRFNLERLGQYLVDQNLTILPNSEHNLWAKFLEENECVAKHATVIPHFEQMSLVQQYNYLKTSVNEIFKKPEVCIAKMFKVSNVITCGKILEPDSLRITHVNKSKEHKILVALVDPSSSFKGFFFTEINTKKSLESQETRPRCVYLNFSPVSRVSDEVVSNDFRSLDVQFYLPEVLSVLLQQENEGKSAVFVQFPVRAALEAARPCADFSSAPRIDATALVDLSALRPVENLVASRFAVSGSRKVAVILSESRRKVRLFEMEVEEEEEEEEVMEATASSIRDSDTSVLDGSKEEDIEQGQEEDSALG